MSKTHEKFKEEFYDIYGDEFTLVSEYTKCNIPIKIKHNLCGTIFSRIPNGVLSNKQCSCPLCNKHVSTELIVGKNDIATTRPDIAKLFLDSDDAYRYKAHSEKCVDFVCPQCGNVINKKIKLVTNKGYLICDCCNDSISYPNKFMANLLKKLNIEYESEYQIKPYDYFYDFKFKYSGSNYVLEMDGSYGHGENEFRNQSKQEQIEIDKIKDEIAFNNGLKIIRIDAKYKAKDNRFEYLCNSIKKSIFNEWFKETINNIDFNDIDKKCQESIVVNIGKAWNNGVRSYDEFEKKFNVKRAGIRRYLNRAVSCGIITQPYSDVLHEIRIASNLKIKKSKGHTIKCNETNEIFYSKTDAAKKYHAHDLYKYFKGEINNCGYLDDGTRLTWTLI